MTADDPMATVADLLSRLPVDEGDHTGQVRMAYRLAGRYAGKLLHVPHVGWHVWDGRRWALDEKGKAVNAVLAVLRRALVESLSDPQLRKDVRRCEGSAGIHGVLDIAGNLPGLIAPLSELDADPYLLNVANGTLDLRTRRLRPHDPNDRITKVTRGAYRPGEVGSGTRWQRFLEEVLPDQEVRQFLQRLIGVSLLGKVVEHVLPALTGTGANGKGVFYMALLHALGDYAAPAEPELFVARDGAHPAGQMDLRGRRLVVVSESDRNRKLAEATMKRLTGGDVIKARYMRQNFVEFTPSHLAVLVTNHLPKVSGDDNAVWRRMRVIPFTVVVPEDKRDSRLGEQLELEADAVLAWAVAGWADYENRDRKLAEPESVQVATAAYRVESDAVARFLDERCQLSQLSPHVRTGVSDLFAAWTAWAKLDGAEPMSAKAFGQALDRHRLEPARVSNGKRWRRGVELLPDEDAPSR